MSDNAGGPDSRLGQILGEGLRLQMARRYAEAEPFFRKVLEIDPRNPDALHCLGVIASAGGRRAEAIGLLRAAIAVEDKIAAFHSNLGLTLQQDGDLEGAIACYRRAIALKPTDIHPHKNLGNALMDLGEPEAAVASYRQALAIAPQFADAHTNLIYALNFIPSLDTKAQQDARKAWGAVVTRGLGLTRMSGAATDADRAKTRLRIGYVSAHFRHQAATYAFAPLILHHDRASFDVVCYSDTLPDAEDDVTQRLKAAATLWRPTAHLTDDQLAAQVRADTIDILVDCVGHMQGNRLPAFVRKPAPIQVTGWGEPTGTGLPMMDYLMADPVLAPAAERAVFSEKIADLPCFLTYWSPDELPAPGPLPAAASGAITFGSFNRAGKITDATLAMWAEILAVLPAATLRLKDRQLANATTRARLMERIVRHGLAPERVILHDFTSRAAHFELYRSVDIALDPTPHGGGMTTLDALWMGLPVITLQGATPSSRLAASVLTAIGCTDWIAGDTASYVTKAVDLARNIPRLETIRAGLRARVQATPVGNSAAYTQAVEAAYRRMHAAWCAQKPPAPSAAPGNGSPWGSPLGWGWKR